MKVTKTTTTPKSSTTTPKPKATTPKKPVKKGDDGFETTAAKTKKTTAPSAEPTAAERRTTATATLLEKGKKKVTTDSSTADLASIQQAAVLLGTLSVSIVLSLMHALEQPVPKPLNAAADQLASLTGALFIEFLSTQIDPDALTAVDHALEAADQFSDRFNTSFGFSPAEGFQRFLGFIGLTEGQPKNRLAGTRYAT